ncbi:MAG: TRAP transporter substrate-binding protein [Sulfurifustis sp.]
MDRRSFIAKASVGVVAGQAIAQQTLAADVDKLPNVRWRLSSSYPKSLDTIYAASEVIAKRVDELTGGKFQIRVFAGGEIVPGLQVLDAVQNGTVECGYSASYYYVGKDPTFAFGTAIPFGFNCRQFNAWWIHGGGNEMLNDFYKGYNVHAILAGNTGAQMGGWYRKEIKTAADLQGLKFRIGGFAGKVLLKLGVVPQQLAGSDIYPALERGTLDAAEWVGPYDDEKLGFHKVAKYYYYPGWWEGGAALHLFVNRKQWESLPAEYKAALEVACEYANTWMVSKYDAQNPAALRRLVASGTQLRAFPKAVMEACYKASVELYKETSATNAAFKKVYDAVEKFRKDQTLWFRVCENTYDNFMGTVDRT